MEEWRDIKGYEGYYQVSSMGRIKGLERAVATSIKNSPTRTVKELILKGSERCGYLSITLAINNTKKRVNIHRLVAEAFLINSDPKNKTQVNHINCDKTDNRVQNLEWCTPKENTRHAEKNGLRLNKAYGNKNPNAKLNIQRVEVVKHLHNKGFTGKQISLLYLVSDGAIYKILNGKSWGHV